MELAALALWCFVVALAGGLVGLVLGNLRLGAVVALADSPAEGAGANIAISGVAAATAAIAHLRAGRVNWRLVGWMGPPSVTGAVAGGYLSGLLPDALLLGLISLVLLLSGIDLLRKGAKPRRRRSNGETAGGDGLDIRAAVVSGALIGLVGGIVGLILGSLRMPALLRLVGEAPARAVGTNVVVGVFVGAAGALGHLPTAAPDAGLLAVGAAASIPGALLGARLTGRLSDAALVRAIGIVLLVAAAATGAQALA